MNRRQKIIVSVTGIFLVLLLLVGLTYAYFLTQITGNTKDKSISASTANLAIVYGDGNGIITSDELIMPGTTLDAKTFTVTNQGNSIVDYVVVIDNVSVKYAETITVNGTTQTKGATTEFESNDFIYTLTCTNKGGSDCANQIKSEQVFPIKGGVVVGNEIEVEGVQTYTLTVTYAETGKDQSNDMNKELNARVNIKDISVDNPYKSDTTLLAYNIINNAKINKNGTKLSNIPTSFKTTEYVESENDRMDIPVSELEALIQPSEFRYSTSPQDACNGSILTTNINLSGLYLCSGGNVLFVKPYNSTEETTALVAVLVTEKTLSVTQDEYGTSYYYRGKVEDNYVEFNNMCWRIVRIEGDGSIKITLAAQKKCSEITEDDTVTAFIGIGHYGYNKVKVTNSSGQQSSNTVSIADYLTSQTMNPPGMKYELDEWYKANLKSVEGKLKKDKWCLGNTKDAYDRETNVLLTSSINDLMYNNTSFNYDIYRRLKGTEAYATLRCDGKNYQSHESYIGALTADELVFAGGNLEGNSIIYLTDNAKDTWATLSPSIFYAYNDYKIVINADGFMNDTPVNTAPDLRPAVTLASGTKISTGDGTINSPYTIQ